jgi:hypothetical protein
LGKVTLALASVQEKCDFDFWLDRPHTRIQGDAANPLYRTDFLRSMYQNSQEGVIATDFLEKSRPQAAGIMLHRGPGQL